MVGGGTPVTSARASRLAGFGHSVPGRRVGNAEIEAKLALEPGWIERRTGIRGRYWAEPGETLSELATKAGEAALKNVGIDPSEIALLLLATSTPDHLLPPTAPLVAHRLGLTNAGAVDLAGACSGFLYALALADGFVRTQGRPVLVVAANILSRRINNAERASAVLFGDAAGAVLLIPSSDTEAGLLGADLASDGAGYDLITIPAGGNSKPFSSQISPEEYLMTIRDGREVFGRAVEMMSACASRALQNAGLHASNVSRFFPHQANARILDALCRKLDIPAQRTVRTITDYGNSSAATIPLSLSLANQARPFESGEKLLLCAAGAGMTGGACLIGT